MTLISRLLTWLLGGEAAQNQPAWKVDRDGRVYLPERKIVLKAKSRHG